MHNQEQDVAYVEVDPNMIVESSIRNVNVQMFSVRQEPFEVYGAYDSLREPWFVRMPNEVAASVSEGVERLAKEPTGCRVRFSTDSDVIAVRAEMAAIAYSPHLTLLASAGFDAYVDGNDESHFQAPFLPPYGTTDGYEQLMRVPFRTRETRNITIFFPTHARVKNLWIGVRPDAKLGKGKAYRNPKPVVFYGSSITHGTGASRPGLVCSNILSNRFNLNTLNLGFSGNAKGEPAMADYIEGLEMAAFVMDYDHNALTVEHLQQTHRPFFARIRESHPNLPVIMLTRPNMRPEHEFNKQMRDVVYQTYSEALQNGDENVYFIDGREYLLPYGDDEAMLDGTHPNDLGYRGMAESISAHLEVIMKDNPDF